MEKKTIIIIAIASGIAVLIVGILIGVAIAGAGDAITASLAATTGVGGLVSGLLLRPKQSNASPVSESAATVSSLQTLLDAAQAGRQQSDTDLRRLLDENKALRIEFDDANRELNRLRDIVRGVKQTTASIDDILGG